MYEMYRVVGVLRTVLLPANLLQKKRPEKFMVAMTARIIIHLQYHQHQVPHDVSYFRHREKMEVISEEQKEEIVYRANLVQRDTTRALNILYAITHTKYAEECDQLSDNIQNCYSEIYHTLVALLMATKKHYGVFWKNNLIVPHIYRLHRMEKIQRSITRLEQKLMDMGAPVIFSHMTAMTARLQLIPKRPLTYSGLEDFGGYRLHIRMALQSMLVEGRSFMSEFFLFPIPVHNLLDTFSDTATKVAATFTTVNEILLFYHQQEMNVKESLLQHHKLLGEDWKNVMADISTWIAGRIYYYREAGPLLPPAPVPTMSGETKLLSKIVLGYTAHEIGLAIRFMIKGQQLTGGTLTEVVELLEPYLKTENADLNPNTVRTKSYDLDPVVLQRLYDKLMELVKLIVAAKAGL